MEEFAGSRALVGLQRSPQVVGMFLGAAVEWLRVIARASSANSCVELHCSFGEQVNLTSR